MTPWTFGMVDMSPGAWEHRRQAGYRAVARKAAWEAAMACWADREDQVQARLDADQVAQRAYHAAVVPEVELKWGER